MSIARYISGAIIILKQVLNGVTTMAGAVIEVLNIFGNKKLNKLAAKLEGYMQPVEQFEEMLDKIKM